MERKWLNLIFEDNLTETYKQFFLIQEFFFLVPAFILVKMKHYGAGKSSLHPKDSATCDNDCEARLSLLVRMTGE